MKKYGFIGYGLGTIHPAGIHRNTLELLKELDKLDEGKNIELIIPSNEIIKCEFNNIKVVKIGCIYERRSRHGKIIEKISRYYWKNIALQRYIKKNVDLSVDLLLTFPRKGSDVIAIYDCIPERMERYYNDRSLRCKRRHIISRQKRAIKKCKRIITDSNHAKRDISDFYNVEQGKIEVVYCGWQHFMEIKEDDSILKKLDLKPRGYFFSLGSRFPHKNVRWITSAAKQNPNFRFVISGQKSSFDDTSFEGDIPENVMFCGYLSDAEVKSLMRYCLAFIQPSLYEGFGIPPMEAMSVGANCIVANRTSLPEVYKDCVWYIDPEDYSNIDIVRIMQQPKRSNEYVLMDYSWAKSARILLDYLKDLM